MTNLIVKLEEASEGSRELDFQIELGLEGNAYRGSADNWVDDCPHYTTSLDAKLPGENILRVSGPPVHGQRTWWEVWHVDPKTDHATFGMGRTEALARRGAALKARA